MPTHVTATGAYDADARRNGGRSPRLRDGIWVASFVALCALVLTLLALTLYQRFNSSGPYRVEYEGRVVRKSLTLSETGSGSYPVFRLHVRGRDGQEFEVLVNRGLYERAEVGMWIKSDREAAKLSRAETP